MPHDYLELSKRQKIHLNSQTVPEKNSIWTHYKGDQYKIENIVMREFNENIEVCYKSLSYPSLLPWVRPLKEWNEIVSTESGIQKRFMLSSQPDSIFRKIFLFPFKCFDKFTSLFNYYYYYIFCSKKF